MRGTMERTWGSLAALKGQMANAEVRSALWAIGGVINNHLHVLLPRHGD